MVEMIFSITCIWLIVGSLYPSHVVTKSTVGDVQMKESDILFNDVNRTLDVLRNRLIDVDNITKTQTQGLDTETPTFDDISVAVDQVKRAYKVCLGDHDLMFSHTVDMSSVETITKMFENGSTEIQKIIQSTGDLIDMWNRNGSVQTESAITQLAIELKSKEDPIDDIIVMKSTKFEQYRRYRSSLLTTKFAMVCSTYGDFYWLWGLTQTLDGIGHDGKNFQQWLLAETNSSRANVTRLVRQLKSDICDATLLMSFCASARNNTIREKTTMFSHSYNTQVALKNLAESVDRTIVTSARANLIEDINELVKPMSWKPNLTIGEQTFAIYQVLAAKYYWLNLNVALYRYEEDMLLSYVHRNRSDCVIHERARASNNVEWDVIVYVWKKSTDMSVQNRAFDHSSRAKQKLDKLVLETGTITRTYYLPSAIWWIPFPYTERDTCRKINHNCKFLSAKRIRNEVDKYLPGGKVSLAATIFYPTDAKLQIHHGGTVGTQVRDGVYMLWTRSEICEYRWKQVYVMASYCMDDPFTYQ